jgi:hypothetical protein
MLQCPDFDKKEIQNALAFYWKPRIQTAFSRKDLVIEK